MKTLTASLLCFFIFSFHLLPEGQAQPQLNPQGTGLQGYISSATGMPTSGFDMGYGFYSGVWSLTEQPVRGFQIGLPATWIIPNNRDNTTEPLCPEGTTASAWLERAPTYDGVFQTVEGGLGYWAGNRFHYGPPKYSMNSVPNCYDGEIASPGWKFFGSDEPLPDDELGIAQLSNRILIPPDGLTFAGDPHNEFLGFAYLALPLTEKKTSPIQVGNNCWTLFVNAQNFKGPVSFVVPDTWVKIAENHPFVAERGLDARPTAPFLAAGTMEINSVPFFKADGNDGATYTKIPELQFSIVDGDRTVLARDVTYYSRDALYNRIVDWKNNAAFPSSNFNVNGVELASLTTWPVQYRQDDIPIEGINELAQSKVFSDQSFGLEWSASTTNAKNNFPQYFKDVGGKRVAITASEVPAETGLTEAEFAKPPVNPLAYNAELKGSWASPGPTSGPHTTILNDNSVVTYYWYKFIDQPVFQQYDWTQEHKDKLQKLVEEIHKNWKIDDEYMQPLSKGTLVAFDDNLIVSPPAGMEIGYVPIVTRQSTVNDLDCSNLNLNLSSTVSQSEALGDFVTLNGNELDALTIKWDNGNNGRTNFIESKTYSVTVVINNCVEYHFSAPFALPASGIDGNSFFANWEQVPGAKGYIIDVSVDAQFNQMLTNWNNREIDNIKKIEVPLNGGTNRYYYRLQTIGYEGEKSVVSETIEVNVNQASCAIEILADVMNTTSSSLNNGAINLTPKGGKVPYQYKWNHGPETKSLSSLQKGTYTVSVTDASNCMVERTFEIGLPIGSGSLGNRVWHDLNRNGFDDYGEPGIPGVKVALWKDTDGDGNPESWLGFKVTDADGYYMHTDLNPGIYQLFVWEIDNFDEGGPLHNMVNTKGQYNPNNDIDKDDNGQPGSQVQSAFNDNNITSKRIVLGADNEPLNDGDRISSSFNFDPSGNMTIDFGFHNNDLECPIINLNIIGSEGVCAGSDNGVLIAAPASGTSPFTYKWNGSQTTSTIEDLAAGDYTVTITDANGCTGTASKSITTLPPQDCILSSLENALPNDIIDIYPNPVSNILYLENNHTERLNARFYNLEGRKVFDFNLKTGKNELGISSAPNGIYIVVITNPVNLATVCKKVVKL